MSDEAPSFVDILRMGVKAWHAWGPALVGDDDERREALQERRGIERQMADLVTKSPMDFVELLVSLVDRTQELDEAVANLHLRIDEAMERGHR
jgi:hypothetical protein